ncbi:NAD(P)H-binding protein [Micromonospora sp. NPDC048842]|uniref:NAD(P)H-binding protein n=1 Tax=Micromonospora sp. NPDC048842 TaxID=3154346 RepID=UPI0034099D8D
MIGDGGVRPRVLVTGATEVVGRVAIDCLLDAGVRTRALVPPTKAAGVPDAVDVAFGDLTAPESLDAALVEIDAMLLVPAGAPNREVLERIRTAGLRRIIVLSSASAPWERAQPRASRHFLAWEQAVEATGLGWTHIRPAGLMAASWQWAEDIRSDSVVREGFPTARYPYVHEWDVAAVAVAALLDQRHDGARYLTTGPAAISAADRVRDLAEAIGRPLRLEQLSEDQAIARWRALGYDEDSIEIQLIVSRDQVDKPPRPKRTVEKVLGRPALPFSQWAIDHAEDFQ